MRHLQEAVDRVDRPGMTIAILPGLYREEPSQPAPTGACARLPARWSDWGYQILSYDQQVQCPHNQNLVAILGKRDLQIEGTGSGPLDVVIDAEYRKLNAVRADRADGVYFRNLTAQRTTFNSLYVLETDGFVIDRVLTRWNDEYGFLTFASDHGLYTDCEAYGNGDGGLYPGSASNLNEGRGHDVPRYAIEIRRCKSHDNALGYSGTAGDSVWVHDNEFYDNMVGATMDSLWPSHPGLPQNHAKFENNQIYDNNRDYYHHTRDGTCAKPPAERGYERGVVCSQVGVPPGTGVIVAGGNYNVFRNNRVWGHRRAGFQLFGVPAFIRGEEDLAKQADTSDFNRHEDNVFGVSPTGERRPNGLDVWWDGQGTGNCWQADAGASSPVVLPVCAQAAPELTGGTRRLLAEPVKLVKLYLCADFSAAEARLPAGCDWFGASGMGTVEAQLALGGSVVLGLVAGLFWWRGRRGDLEKSPGGGPAAVRRRQRLILAGTVAGGLGLVLDVVAAAVGTAAQTGVALLLMGAWWWCLGAALVAGRPVFGWFTVVVGVLACVDAFDRLVYLIPFVPLGPGWVRGLLTGFWVLCAVVVLAPRRSRAVAERSAEAEVAT
ncbi:right-handed parallel beta-helix repeat-containing protein [Nonomuraea gerenzanensis]|uniref:Putative lipoprotein n=1 Tax=Nonomuraea gerenzanensis TaxID=93944 RepID=A0A1M4E6D8_9ACTN|nr:right-handed parallel beta-helix repeat-containing protein [Nonomuraea gerenzanensis]UBU16538.1 right-handed parallel beta-helix repeat-containing protein [Nonomuraea gerenzanensis]SBO94363.1 putative lipoprotein [Nonomuraea gerenzanensis]